MANEHGTLQVEYAGVGIFKFRHRTLRDEIRIEAERAKLTAGCDTPTQWLRIFSEVYATLAVLTAAAPDGWDLERMDPQDPDVYTQMLGVFGALRAAEDRFRGRSGGSEPQGRPEAGGDGGALVPPDLQSPAQ